MKITRNNLLEHLAFANRQAKITGDPLLRDGIQSIMSWLQQGGKDRLFRKSYMLPEHQAQTYLHTMARALCDDPSSLDIGNS